MVTEPSPETMPEKVAKPPLAAVRVAAVLLAMLPLKVALPASAIPNVPEPMGAFG